MAQAPAWGILARADGRVSFGAYRRELFGYDPNTTNNRMELMAPIQGLLALN